MSAEQTPLFVYLTEAMIIEETVAMHQQRLQKHDREAAASKPCFEPLEAPELYVRRPEPLNMVRSRSLHRPARILRPGPPVDSCL